MKQSSVAILLLSFKFNLPFQNIKLLFQTYLTLHNAYQDKISHQSWLDCSGNFLGNSVQLGIHLVLADKGNPF